MIWWDAVKYLFITYVIFGSRFHLWSGKFHKASGNKILLIYLWKQNFLFSTHLRTQTFHSGNISHTIPASAFYGIPTISMVYLPFLWFTYHFYGITTIYSLRRKELHLPSSYMFSLALKGDNETNRRYQSVFSIAAKRWRLERLM